MKSFQSFFEGVYITPSEVLEYLFCPRFIYFMNCLCIPQHEEQRFKVQKGRDVHKERTKINKSYLRKKIGCVKKEIDVHLSSEKYHLKGIVDEVLYLGDGTLAPMDYKYAEYKERIFETYRFQSVMYGMLIQENYGKEVNRGFVCYVRSRNLVKQIPIHEVDVQKTVKILEEMLEIIQSGFYPKKTKYKAKCIDCCYKNICV
jgi:CRISPR-associated exonuclease Cas4